MGKGFRISDETRRRCKIIDLDAREAARFRGVNPELLHFLYAAERIDFNIYLRVETTMIEFIRKEEFSKELLDQLWAAMSRSSRRLEIHVLRTQAPLLEQLIEDIRGRKIDVLLEKLPHLDRRTVEVFNNLSNASQLIVRGGITREVAERVRASAAFMVANLLDSSAAMSTLSRMVIHDPTLYDHSASVAMFAAMIANTCLPKKSLPQKQVELIGQCGLYHDLGKTCVPSAILNKPGKFTPEEFEVMKTHAALGEQELLIVIEQGAPVDRLAARVAGEHHERFCGSGYPRGRRGRYEDNPDQGIHLFSRVVSIADVYSALLMKRVYKPSYEPQDAIRIMAEHANEDYDPEIFGAFLRQVIDSLNAEQRHGGKGRILQVGADGHLVEHERAS